MNFNLNDEDQPRQPGIDQRRPGGGRRPPRDLFLINDITRAIINEAHAYNYYQKLAELAPNERDRRTILGIRQDEARHYNQFVMVLRRMGRRPPIVPPGELPRNFREGVRAAIRDEQEAVTFYRSIASRATDRSTQAIFRNASRDEQRHAGLLEEINRSLR